MDLLFRKYTKSDIAQVQHLMSELGYSIDLDALQINIAEIGRRGGQLFVAEENSLVIGCVAVILDARLAEGVYAEIVSLVVGSPARGRGIGKGLVQMAEGWARQYVDKVRVRTNELRRDARFFYEALGYECTKTQRVYKKSL